MQEASPWVIAGRRIRVASTRQAVMRSVRLFTGDSIFAVFPRMLMFYNRWGHVSTPIAGLYRNPSRTSEAAAVVQLFSSTAYRAFPNIPAFDIDPRVI
jgi:hypothetical protein